MFIKLSKFSPIIMISLFVGVVIVTLYIAISSSNVETEELELTLQQNKFEPEIIKASSDKRIKIYIHNQDNNVEEFESTDLNREKIVPAHSTIKITVGPLKPGEYNFFGDFSPDTAQGKLKID